MSYPVWIAAHLLACLALVLLLGVPGAALVRLLGRLDHKLPRVLLPPAAVVLGLAQLTLLLAAVLTLEGSMAHLLVAHAVVSVALVVAAIARARRGAPRAARLPPAGGAARGLARRSQRRPARCRRRARRLRRLSR